MQPKLVWMLCLGTPFLSIKNTPRYNLKSVLFIPKKEMVVKREEVVEGGWIQKCHAGRKSLLSGSLPERVMERGMRQGSRLRPAEKGNKSGTKAGLQ